MKKLFALAVLAGLAAGCLGPRRAPPVSAPLPGEAVVTPPPAVSTGAAVSVLWTVPEGQDPLAAAQFLEARPALRLSVLFPERFFGEDENARKAKALFSALVSRGQVEVLLTLPNRPVLALLQDSDLAKLSTTTAAAPLPPRYHWPEDAAGQVALAKSVFRRRWKTSPAGLAVPWGAAVGPELEPVAKAGLRWVYLGARGEPGLYEAGGMAAVVASPLPAKADAAGRREWFRRAFSADQPQGVRTPLLASTLDNLTALEALAADIGPRWLPVGEFLAAFPPERAKPFPPADLSPWIGEAEENRAWQLLGVARQAFEDFKNSGRADVRTLDRAMRAIYGAEDGAVFLTLGADGVPARAAEVKREFLASLEQVFRLLGASPPPALRRGFAGGGGAEASEESSDPFFRREGAVLSWRDDARDDRGPGDFFYPTGGGFPTGAWDLTSFRVEPRASEVVFRWALAALANPGNAPYGFSLALVDTYIDINRLPGAGAENLLPGRPGLVESQNAWEYALSVDGWGARLYQPGTGGGPRRLAALPVKVVPPATLEVTVPRKYLRGEPGDWGFSVAVMGRSPASIDGGEPAPMKVLEQSGPDHFGGAIPGHPAPPYVDLLSEGPVQNEVLGAYRQGRDASLPFVRADETAP